jgi:anthranilate synthase/aminodeoxychorismate synthase-like glutamine amidotransferase
MHISNSDRSESYAIMSKGRGRVNTTIVRSMARSGGNSSRRVSDPDCQTPAERGLFLVFVLDNYDSFTYNLVQYLGELGATVEVRRNDQVTVSQVEKMKPERIVISPGPCTPQEAGISVDLIRRFAGKVPVLGVCLGHQAIGEAFGGRVVRAGHVMHGKTSAVMHDNKTIFQGLPMPMTATRYHSLIVEEKDLPEDLEVSAWTNEKDGTRTIMGLRHRQYPVEGVQFHPESVLTDAGKKLVANFLAVDSAQ